MGEEPWLFLRFSMIPVCKTIGENTVFKTTGRSVESADSDQSEGLGRAGDSAFLASSQVTPLAQRPQTLAEHNNHLGSF